MHVHVHGIRMHWGGEKSAKDGTELSAVHQCLCMHGVQSTEETSMLLG